MSDRERWNERWKKAQEPGEPSSFFESRLPLLLRDLRRIPQARVLDVACGLGRHLLPLTRQGILVDGADLSETALERLGSSLRRQALPGHLIPLDLADSKAAGESLGLGRYDLILDFFYLERSLLPVLARAAKPGGLLLFETRLAAGGPGTFTNPKGFWLAPGELGGLLWRDWQVAFIEERGGIARALAKRR